MSKDVENVEMVDFIKKNFAQNHFLSMKEQMQEHRRCSLFGIKNVLFLESKMYFIRKNILFSETNHD
jgi:hypothetical protein